MDCNLFVADFVAIVVQGTSEDHMVCVEECEGGRIVSTLAMRPKK